MGSVKSPQQIADECRRRAQEAKSEGDREQLIEISRRLRDAEDTALTINIVLPEDKQKPQH